MEPFRAASREFAGNFRVQAPVEEAFELFSPLGERRWVRGWNPELLYPSGVVWTQGQIFRTREELGDAIWVVTGLNRDAHEVEYHRLEPQRYVARVRVTCAASAEAVTEVSVIYTFIGLSLEGNMEIEAMTARAYAEKMDRWQRWIAEHLADT